MNSILFQKLIPKRGEIFLQDKDGLYPVAVNKNVEMVYAVPKGIEDASLAADKLSEFWGSTEMIFTPN